MAAARIGSKPGIIWSKTPAILTPVAQHLPYFPDVFYMGVDLIERSEDLLSDNRDFYVPTLYVLEDIYNFHENRSEVVKEYAWPNQESGLRIGALGLGLDEELPTAFDNRAMILFTRWMGQNYAPYKWTKFQCVYGWKVDGEIQDVVVAEGNFSSFYTGLKPPILDGLQLPDTQTS